MNRQRGFTLIEVVAAFVLLAVVLGMAFEVFSAGLARAGQLEDRSRALAIAQSQLALTGVEQVLKATPAGTGRRVTLPLVKSRRPGALRIDNAQIYDVISVP